jgi:HAE1 family hydrophobic/amphiphilic exporter-1
MIRRILILLIALSPVGAGAQTLSRVDAVKAALDANPDVVRAREDLRSLEGRITEVKADALPEVTFRANTNRYRDPSLLNSSSFDSFPIELRDSLKPIPANLTDGIAEVKQTLYSFKLGRALKVAKLARSLGQEDSRRVRQKIALDALQAYDNLLLTLEYVRVNQRTLDQKEQHLTSVRNRRTAGVATELDVLRSEVDVENQRAQLVRAEGRVDFARATLNAVMLKPIDAPIQPTDALTRQPIDTTLDQALTAALAERPEIKSAQITEQTRDELVGVEQAERKPHFDFTGNYGYSVREPVNFFHYNYSRWSFAVSATVPIFDGGRAAGRIAQAQAERAKAMQDRLSAENQIRLQVKDAYDRLTVAERLLKAADLNVAQAQKAVDMTQANYGLGAATQLDVTDAQAALTEAERVRIDALHDHADARATLRFAMGRDPLEGLEQVAQAQGQK